MSEKWTKSPTPIIELHTLREELAKISGVYDGRMIPDYGDEKMLAKLREMLETPALLSEANVKEAMEAAIKDLQLRVESLEKREESEERISPDPDRAVRCPRCGSSGVHIQRSEPTRAFKAYAGYHFLMRCRNCGEISSQSKFETIPTMPF